MLVAVRYLGNETMTGVNQIEDWYLPAGAFKTAFVDTAGRTLYLVGTKEQIAKESARMDKPGATMQHFGHSFKYVAPHHITHTPHVAPAAKVVAPAIKKAEVKKAVAPTVETKTVEVIIEKTPSEKARQFAELQAKKAAEAEANTSKV